MRQINLLTQDTINKIAAGEVIERPSSIVKELVENAIDAGSNAITVEIKEGGISFIRITDNGEGISKDQVPTAFLRHATSKIKCVEDLLSIGSLGFRGEALSSIAAVCQVELITKTAGSLTGVRYLIEGGKEKGLEEIGAPEGSTFLVRNIFYNTPARKKFLKSPATEAGYISDLLEHLALSHPEISFKFINNGQTRLHTSGNCNLKDIIYSIYGRDIAANLVEIHTERDGIEITGFIGKPVISRGNRNFENYFVNKRYVKSSILSKAIEEGYKTFMMQHRYPFTVLRLEMDGSMLDINVHPTKMELRFADNAGIYQFVYETVKAALTHRELIPQVTLSKENEREKSGEKNKEKVSYPEPFEKIRRDLMAESQSPYQPRYSTVGSGRPNFLKDAGTEKMRKDFSLAQEAGRSGSHIPSSSGIGNCGSHIPPSSGIGNCGSHILSSSGAVNSGSGISSETGRPEAGTDVSKAMGMKREKTIPDLRQYLSERKSSCGSSDIPPMTSLENGPGNFREQPLHESSEQSPVPAMEQLNLFDERLLSRQNVQEHRLIGQVFDTYWIVQFRENLYIIDQHAAHEKVMYERLTNSLKTKEFTSQRISPPLILTLSMQEEVLLKKYISVFREVGFEIEHFGGREYSICSVPDNLFGFTEKELFIDMLDSLSETTGQPSADILNEKLATMACKSAVKGNNRLSVTEANALIQELLSLENPYNCPHGRPTIISMSKYELEKKFKRIV